MKHHSSHGFTLVELLIVITVIAVLAGLTLNIAGLAQEKSARARAGAEIASLSAALLNYKVDHGDYPLSSSPQTTPDSTDQTLTANLSPATGRVYFDFSKGGTNSSKAAIDPFGNGYGYQYPGSPSRGGTNFFDLWSTANKGVNSNAWIKNW